MTIDHQYVVTRHIDVWIVGLQDYCIYADHSYVNLSLAKIMYTMILRIHRNGSHLFHCIYAAFLDQEAVSQMIDKACRIYLECSSI